jgi:hypothetical protein
MKAGNRQRSIWGFDIMLLVRCSMSAAGSIVGWPDRRHVSSSRSKYAPRMSGAVEDAGSVVVLGPSVCCLQLRQQPRRGAFCGCFCELSASRAILASWRLSSWQSGLLVFALPAKVAQSKPLARAAKIQYLHSRTSITSKSAVSSRTSCSFTSRVSCNRSNLAVNVPLRRIFFFHGV